MRVALAVLGIGLAVAAGGAGAARHAAAEPAFAEYGPVWSPDGTKLAFSRLGISSHRVRQSSLYVANADGTQPGVVVLGAPTNDYGGAFSAEHPTWSPDGLRLAYVVVSAATRYEPVTVTIHVVNADGTGDHAITAAGAPGTSLVYSTDPAWSPTGSKIAFIRNAVLHVMNDDGTGVTPLTTDAGGDAEPAWSPDGSKIAYTWNSQLYVVNSDGAGRAPLVTSVPAADPAWSPDGSRIAFASGTTRVPTSDVWVANDDGSGLVKVADGRAYDGDPSWSRDSHSIVFVSNRRVGRYSSELWSMDPDGVGQHPLVARSGRAANGRRCTIFGTAAGDVLDGTRGNDVLCGFDRNDVIDGGSGNDVLDGGAGEDRLVGGSGNDTLLARDRRRDFVFGGRGRDSARIDGRRIDKVNGVERFLR